MYKSILIDLDDTLFDFQKSELLSIRNILEDFNLPVTPEIINDYHEYNLTLWKQIEEGTLTKCQLLSQRFPGFLGRFNIDVPDGIKIDNQFRKYLVQNTTLLPDAHNLLDSLKGKNYKLYAASNGVYDTQIERLHLTKIDHYFDNLFISEKIGYAKPDKRFFESAFTIGDITHLNEVIMIGDSLTSDIQGANNIGIDCIWLNRFNQEANDQLRITETVTNLNEIIRIII